MKAWRILLGIAGLAALLPAGVGDAIEQPP